MYEEAQQELKAAKEENFTLKKKLAVQDITIKELEDTNEYLKDEGARKLDNNREIKKDISIKVENEIQGSKVAFNSQVTALEKQHRTELKALKEDLVQLVKDNNELRNKLGLSCAKLS